jgi:hypothetical protein
MEEIFARMWANMTARPTGALYFRFVLQPTVAILLAIRAGMRDSKAGRPPYLWAVFTSRVHRRILLKDGWKDIAKVFCLAIILDVVFQLITFRWIYPLESVLIAVALSIFPYVLVRGPVNRFRTGWNSRS